MIEQDKVTLLQWSQRPRECGPDVTTGTGNQDSLAGYDLLNTVEIDCTL